jgi:hypothetical protein
MFGRVYLISLYSHRRVVGLFKLATRMLSRQQICGPILHLLWTLFGSRRTKDDHSGVQGAQPQRKDPHSNESDESEQIGTVHDYILSEISGQVSLLIRGYLHKLYIDDYLPFPYETDCSRHVDDAHSKCVSPPELAPGSVADSL